MLRNVAILLTGAVLALSSQLSHAQQDMSPLKPSPGSHVSLFEFADLECPMCARQNPVLKDASAKYHVPWIRHDFPLQMHVWSFQAAVNARWFDTQPKKLGNDYRDAVFASQSSIETKDDLRSFTDKFAQQHGVALPFVLDPQGKLEAEVKADYALGVRLGVHQTPTVWIVTDRSGGAAPYTEVTDFNKLYTALDQAVAQTGHGKK
ncbi:protein-disulfide isomerase [Silvibacterium bohemicum]|uniref:Protein-disulfide isomerase n=1 Tax=Silvibacterium bohemicum TaxID=1577686 RepID=A0A841JU09_9BACT|nr:thioredoxin domain-containing protein [Silvibacterium bohemicum]MBB6144640.1 protein-disulfide isomerase [Silvibacterium bohemicum]